MVLDLRAHARDRPYKCDQTYAAAWNVQLKGWCYRYDGLIVLTFFLRKKGYINFVSNLVCLSVPPSCFLVIVSPPKGLDAATSNFAGV